MRGPKRKLRIAAKPPYRSCVRDLSPRAERRTNKSVPAARFSAPGYNYATREAFALVPAKDSGDPVWIPAFRGNERLKFAAAYLCTTKE